MVNDSTRLGVVILNHNDLWYIPACIEALRCAITCEWHLWVVDNGSIDESSQVIPSQLNSNETWIEAGLNLGYAGGNNLGILAALEWGANLVLVINPDCIVTPNFLPPLLGALKEVSTAGIACPLVLDESGKVIQSLGGEVNLWTGLCRRRGCGRIPDKSGSASWTEVDWPHGSCMLMKREFLQRVGLMRDEYFLYYEDVEYGLRAALKGWRTLAVPGSEVHHRDTTTTGFLSPIVTFYGTRNQIWVEKEYANAIQFLVFILVSAIGRWPKHFVSRLWRGHPKAATAVLRGAWAGLFSHCKRSPADGY